MFKTVRHRVSIILVLCMLISSVFVSKINTVSAQEVDSDEYNEAFEALKTFGILEDNIEYLVLLLFFTVPLFVPTLRLFSTTVLLFVFIKLLL